MDTKSENAIRAEDKALEQYRLQKWANEINQWIINSNDEAQKIYIRHRDRDRRVTQISAPYSIPRQSFGPHPFKNQKQEFVQFLDTCAFETKMPCSEDSTFTNYEAKMPEHVPEPEPPSSVQDYSLAINHMQDEWKDILKLREALKKNCAEVNKIVDQIKYRNENMIFWRDMAEIE